MSVDPWEAAFAAVILGLGALLWWLLKPYERKVFGGTVLVLAVLCAFIMLALVN